MYAKNDKRRLYQLMDMYVDGVITASVFCDEFYYAYDLEIADKDLTETERYMFTELDKISSRFSEWSSIRSQSIFNRIWTPSENIRSEEYTKEWKYDLVVLFYYPENIYLY